MNTKAQKVWDDSFEEQIKTHSYNTSPVEAIIRTASYYLRARNALNDYKNLKFLEMGSGGGINLMWLAEKGIRISGVDISPVALELCRRNIDAAGYNDLLDDLVECSVTETPFEDNSFDGIFESCVFQHLNKEEREKSFKEAHRILKPGGAFFGYMLGDQSTLYQKEKATKELPDDKGTLYMEEEGVSKIYVQNVGLVHFYSKEELEGLLSDFSEVDCCLAQYEIPKEEAKRRGYDSYLQSMWIVYAVK